MPTISLILRLKNEERFLPAVLTALSTQTFTDFEVIAVLNNSTDNTRAILQQFQANLTIHIHDLPDKFDYATACNFGAEQSSGEIIGYLSGHSVPIFDDYLEKGLVHFQEEKVAGVYGPVLPLDNASIWERVWYTAGLGTAVATARIARQQSVSYTEPRMGLLGNTNSLLRKKLWQAYPFQAAMADGGEDIDWALHYLQEGYIIVKDPRLAVKHSHGIGLVAFIRQFRHWQRVHNRAVQRNR